MCNTPHQLYSDWKASPDVHAIIMKGAGGDAFCAGGDVRSIMEVLLARQQKNASPSTCLSCRPKALNALNQAMCETLHRMYCDWEASPDVHAIILKGAGGKAFCAGGDVKGMVQLLLAGQQEKAIRSAFRLCNAYKLPCTPLSRQCQHGSMRKPSSELTNVKNR